MITTSIAILNNPLPSAQSLTFYVQLRNARNGAILSTDSLVTVRVLPVENPCGVIEFNQVSQRQGYKYNLKKCNTSYSFQTLCV